TGAAPHLWRGPYANPVSSRCYRSIAGSLAAVIWNCGGYGWNVFDPDCARDGRLLHGTRTGSADDTSGLVAGLDAGGICGTACDFRIFDCEEVWRLNNNRLITSDRRTYGVRRNHHA